MRNDEELRRDVEDELAWEPGVDHRQIGVAIRDGVVTLIGEAHSCSQKWMAERAVDRVAGVRGVLNEMMVSITAPCADAEITAAAVNTLVWNAQVPKDSIRVEVEDGWITLTGEVEHDYQRRAAECVVRNLRGIRGVSNLATVRRCSSSGDTASQIQRALRRGVVLHPHEITIEVRGDAVTLRGAVRSCRERRTAEEAALRSPGVTFVNNLLVVKESSMDADLSDASGMAPAGSRSGG